MALPMRSQSIRKPGSNADASNQLIYNSSQSLLPKARSTRGVPLVSTNATNTALPANNTIGAGDVEKLSRQKNRTANQSLVQKSCLPQRSPERPAQDVNGAARTPKETPNATHSIEASPTGSGQMKPPTSGRNYNRRSLGQRPDERVGPNSSEKQEHGAITRQHIRTSSLVSRDQQRTKASPIIGDSVASLKKPSNDAKKEQARAAGEVNKRLRPAFSAYQQQFSPNKRNTTTPNSKSTSNVGTPTQPSHSMSISTTRQQAELLQLCLLLEAAPVTQEMWIQSAHQKLQKRYLEAVRLYRETRESELRAQQHANLLAMKEWSPHPSPTVLQKKLRTLIDILTDLFRLSDPVDGEYALLMQRVQVWVDWVRSIWAARDQHINEASASVYNREDTRPRTPLATDNGRADLVEGLGDAMKSEIHALAQKVNVYITQLETMHEPSPTGGSSTAILLDSCLKMTAQMRDELQAIREIEFEVSLGEKAWLDESVESVANSIGNLMISR